MACSEKNRKAGLRALRSSGRYWICVALLSAPRLGVAQNGADLSKPDLRASVNQSQIRPASSILTPEMRGDIYMARKRYYEAIDMYKQTPMTPGIYNKIGIAFHELSQLQVAKKYYGQAIKADPSFAEAINNLGTLYYAEKSYGKAIVYFKRSLKYSGPIAAVEVNIGAAYFERHNYKKSFSYYEEALKLDPNVLERHSGFGTRMQDRTKTDLSLFHLYLAKTYAKAGSDERALSYLRKALEEGLKNRKNLSEVPEFSRLREKPEFLEILAEDPKPL